MRGRSAGSDPLAGSLAPVWLLASEEPLLLVEHADRLRARLRAEGYVEREVFDLAEGVDWNAFAAAAHGGSLFAARRLVELRLPEGEPSAEGARAIVGWCARPPPETVLLILAGAWSRRHEGPWSRAVAEVGRVVVLPPPRGPRELAAWIGERLASRGLPALPALVALLAERTEGNLLACAQEIEKLAILAAGRELEPRGLERLIAEDARFRVFDLADAALAGEGARVLAILDRLRREGEAPAALIPWLARELLALAEASRGGAAQPRFGERARAFAAARRRASAAYWERCLVALARAERLAKGRGEPDDPPPDPRDAWIALERLLLAVALGPARGSGLLT